MGPSYHMPFCDCNAARLAPELLVPMGPSPYLRFCMQTSDFWTRITSLYGSQTSPVVLCVQNGVISTRITGLYGSQHSYVFLCIQNSAPFLPLELLVSMCPSPHLCFCAFKIATLVPQLQGFMCPRPHLWFCACKTA